MKPRFLGVCGGFCRQAGTLPTLPPPGIVPFWGLGVLREPSGGGMGLGDAKGGLGPEERDTLTGTEARAEFPVAPTAAPPKRQGHHPARCVLSPTPLCHVPPLPGRHQHHVWAGDAGHELPGGQRLHLHQRLHRQAGQLDPQQPLPAGGHRPGAGHPPGTGVAGDWWDEGTVLQLSFALRVLWESL